MNKVVKNTKIPTTLTLKGKLPVVRVPSSGKPDWYEGARTMCFVYTKHCGNFILEGYRGEVEKYLKENYTKYFCYTSMWSNGRSRGIWSFWKDKGVTIFTPSKHRKDWKYKIVSYVPRYSYRQEEKKRFEIYLKRMPKRWIPEFDKL